MKRSRWNRMSAGRAIGTSMALGLVLLGAGCGRSGDAGMGMHGGMMSHGGMHHMVGPGDESSDNSTSTNDTTSEGDGVRVYTYVCATCHRTGVAGAPRFGDEAAWKPRLKQGRQALYDHALHGYRGMPPKGGRMELSDAQVEAAVDYMVQNSASRKGK